MRPTTIPALTTLLGLSAACAAREITFPPHEAVDAYSGLPLQAPFHDEMAGLDLSTGSAFSGLMTFANLPHVHCLSADKEVGKYDIAFLGAPFDTVRSVRVAWGVVLCKYECIFVMITSSVPL